MVAYQAYPTQPHTCLTYSLVGEIRQILVSCAGDYPDLEMIAGAFGMSSRTLRRHLAESGTSYQKLLNETRRELAMRCLRNGQMSIEQIAENLGFSDVTNFRHAFKKWVGTSPAAFRATLA